MSGMRDSRMSDELAYGTPLYAQAADHWKQRAAAAEARAHRLATSLDEANAARHGTIDKLNAAVLARKAAEAECARLRARLEEATGCHWWVCTDWLRDGGRKKLGPFTTARDALVARQYVERAEHTDKYFVDSDRAAGDS